jgi:urate oxidase
VFSLFCKAPGITAKPSITISTPQPKVPPANIPCTFVAGLKDLQVLKTTQSGYEGYLKDEYTALPETKDRILATRCVGFQSFLYQDTRPVPMAAASYFSPMT